MHCHEKCTASRKQSSCTRRPQLHPLACLVSISTTWHVELSLLLVVCEGGLVRLSAHRKPLLFLGRGTHPSCL